jgi:hypothetical protein
MNILKIDDIFKLKILKYHFKLKNGKLHIYFHTLPTLTNGDVHSHNTRGGNKIFVTREKHMFKKKCIRHVQIQLLNDTPDLIKKQNLKLAGHLLSYGEYCHNKTGPPLTINQKNTAL